MFRENASLAYRIADILRTSTDDRTIINAVDALASTHGNDVYEEFFYVLTSKRFGTETAVIHWKNIVSRIPLVIRPRYRHQGFLPTVLQYMRWEAGLLRDPRFIEAEYITNIRRSSITDGLTGLYNQTFFKSRLSKMINQPRQHAVTPFAVVLFDLDHFKQYNDTSGHLAGDHALKRVAEIVLDNLRESDIASRYGGEEFALLLPHTTRVLASSVAQRIRLDIESEIFPGQEQLPSGNLTISGGIAEYPKDAENAVALIEIADAELYKAKVRRNCIYPAEGNRRNSLRRPLQSLVEFSPSSEHILRSGISLDISEFGMALGCDMILSIGSPVNLHFKRPFWNGDYLLQGTVCQARKLGDLNFIGIEFRQTFSAFDVGPLSTLDHHHYRKKVDMAGAFVEELSTADPEVCADAEQESFEE